MPAFFIAQIRIEDPEVYRDYLAGFMPIFERHGGRLLVTSAKPVERLEGTWPEGGVVVMEFPDLDSARAWKNDPDYIALAAIRQRSANTNMVLVEGI